MTATSLPRSGLNCREGIPMISYFIRQSGDVCAVIGLHPDNREEVVQSGLSLPEAEILCITKMARLPKPAALLAFICWRSENYTGTGQTGRKGGHFLQQISPQGPSFDRDQSGCRDI